MRPEPCVPVQVALMTGRSDPSHCRPSPAQAALFSALASPGVRVLGSNFPWTDEGGALAAPVPLLRASLANARQYLGSRRRRWAARHRPRLEARVALAERTVLLCGSCGLELLANLDAAPATLARLHVLAFGPVARCAPAVRELVVVRGRRDRISRWGFRARVDNVIDAGHLDYLQHPDTIALAEALVARVLEELARGGGVHDAATAPSGTP